MHLWQDNCKIMFSCLSEVFRVGCTVMFSILVIRLFSSNLCQDPTIRRTPVQSNYGGNPFYTIMSTK